MRRQRIFRRGRPYTTQGVAVRPRAFTERPYELNIDGLYRAIRLFFPSENADLYKLVRTECDFPQQMIFSRSRKRTYHICEANISLRSNFTCPLGQISLRNCLAVAPWGPRFLREQFFRPLLSDKSKLLCSEQRRAPLYKTHPAECS